MRCQIIGVVLSALLSLATGACAAPGKAFTDEASAGPDYQMQGEYAGQLADKSIGMQIIALDEGKFHAVEYQGGLPGAGWDKSPRKEYDAQAADGVVKFDRGGSVAQCDARAVTVTSSGGERLGQLTKVERTSPTIGAAPPAGAVVLFDGASRDALLGGGTITAEKTLEVGPNSAGKRGDIVSQQSFGSFTLHLEFHLPFMPSARGQGRGNSGLYLQNRYECQILDSFGLSGENNECGGFYTLRKPDVNMCLPPLVWQTYDIDFTAPKFDNSGTKTTGARVTVRHNGVLIHDDFEFPKLTPGGEKTEAAVGPFKLQDHGNPVQFRNFWVVEKKSN